MTATPSTAFVRRVLVAPSGFKESLDAEQVARAISAGVRRAVPGVALGEHRAGRGREEQRDETHRPTDHDEAPAIGRTVTTLNMPACMCISM